MLKINLNHEKNHLVTLRNRKVEKKEEEMKNYQILPFLSCGLNLANGMMSHLYCTFSTKIHWLNHIRESANQISPIPPPGFRYSKTE